MIGDRIAGASTLESNPVPLTAPQPLATTVAPMMPPISAWLELDGSERYHVIRFQAIAPISAANTSVRPVVPVAPENTLGSTMPLAIVAATWIEMKAPTRLRTADINTATRGFSAPVAIDVATALAVS